MNYWANKKKQSKVNESKLGENILNNPKDIAEGFNNYFSNIGPDLASQIQTSTSNFETYVKIAISEFAAFQHTTVDNVYQPLSRISSNKATGIDKISCKMIRMAAPAIADSLTYIFNQAITLPSFPDEWKIARVIPLFKSGHRNMPGNYRPISILPAISKIMELMESFRKSHSTATALLDCTNEWYMNIDKKMFSLVVFIDLKKAFDTVNHGILVKKLKSYGIKGQALDILKSYLSNRRQKCQVDKFVSSECFIECGVPQGSILGPLLFLLYINDLPECLKNTRPRLFADDTNLTASSHSIADIEIAANSDLENLRHWLIANKLSLNVAKTEFMFIGSPQMLRNVSNYQANISIDNKQIQQSINPKH